jgi:aminotransferase
VKTGGIRRFCDLARELPDCINLSLGEPDFCVSQSALELGCQAAEKGQTHYTPANGIPELRAALAEKAHNGYGLDYHPNCEVLVTCGAGEAISLSLLGLVNPGDGVIIPNPGFVGYEPCVALAGGRAVDLPLSEEREFCATAADVTPIGASKSRVILLNFPNNRTGAVLSHDDAASLAGVAVERDIFVISYEVYEKIVYD